MASRRTFLKAGLGAWAAGGLVVPGFAEELPHAFYKTVFDERFEDATVFAAGATKRGIPAAAIRGDITSLFYNDLDLRWRQGPVLLAGYTAPAALFCLDLLARDRGMRLQYCAADPGAEEALRVLDGGLPPQAPARFAAPDASARVFWILAPPAKS